MINIDHVDTIKTFWYKKARNSLFKIVILTQFCNHLMNLYLSDFDDSKTNRKLRMGAVDWFFQSLKSDKYRLTKRLQNKMVD